MSNPVLSRTLNEIAETRYETSAAGIQIPVIQTKRMTIEGTMSRTIMLFAVLLFSGALAWISGLAIPLLFPAMIIALGLGLFAAFSKKVRPGLYVAYAVAEGIFLAGISQLFETMYDGIVHTAVMATVVTAGTMFIAYQRQWIKVTNRFRAVMSYALMGYLAFALINFGVAIFTGSSAYSTSFGWLIALAGVGLAAFTLVMDFADIEAAAGMGVEESYEWRAAFGLMVTLVWMYIEILRLLAILRGQE